jgi:hypothetical protein
MFFQQFIEHFQTKQSNQEIANQMLTYFNEAIQQQNTSLDKFKTTQTNLIQNTIDQKLSQFSFQHLNNTTQLEKNITQQLTHTKDLITPLSTSIHEISSKFTRTAREKGETSELVLFNLLCDSYPTANIEHVGATTKFECDIFFQRHNKPKILVENKDYKNILPTKQVEKFIRDISLHKCSGLFLSQASGITYQDDYSFQIIDGFVCVFLHNVCYDINKINVAISIIDHLQEQIDLLEQKKLSLQPTNNQQQTNNVSVPESTIHLIHDEIKTFAESKITLLKTIQEQSKTFNTITDTLKTQLDHIKLPNLHNFLSIHCNTHETSAIANTTTIQCHICNLVCTSKKGLSQHVAKMHKKTTTD